MSIGWRAQGAAWALLAATSGCSGGDDLVDGHFTAEEWAALQMLSPLPPAPDDPYNKYADDPAAAELGHQLFFDSRYSGALGPDNECVGCGAVGVPGDSQKMGCYQCHMPPSFADRRSNPSNTSLGVSWTERNAPSLINVVHYEWLGWAGKQDSLFTQAAGSPESSTNSKGTRLGYAHLLFDHYRDEYDAIFDDPLPAELDPAHPDAARFPPSGKPKSKATDPDGPWEGMTPEDQDTVNRIMANQGKAVAAYERLLVSGEAPFDRYIAGDTAAISESAKRGARLFVGKAGCVACHSGPTFTDNDFHNNGAPQIGDHVLDVDEGRYEDVAKLLSNTFNTAGPYSDDRTTGKLDGVAQDPADRGKFRTKQLRSVAESAPYYHTGALATLRDVVEFYNLGGGESGYVGDKDPKIVPLNLSTAEIDDLVAFLESLTGEGPPPELLAAP